MKTRTMKRRNLMVLGTSSDAGKSVLAAGLCRIAKRRGLSVAPFKSQNMSNNAAVTAAGHEIGRAQALQAVAAGIEPDSRMNPILLKPEGERRSQIVLEGRAFARADFREYDQYRARCVDAIDRSLASLREEYDVLVCEGAGSPVEINLMERDIANLFVARRADAEIVLVGDIDRGGIFASFVGTLALLPDEDRERLGGLVVNRFRGDVTLLEPGLVDLAERTGTPVLGVVPYLDDLGLPEEDGQSIVVRNASRPDDAGRFQVAVVRLPRLANQDDLVPFEREEEIAVRYVDRAEGLEGVDLVVLPGSKNTRADLAWLRTSGLAEAITRRAEAGGRVHGICGGYQMLGRSVADPSGFEGEAGSTDGLDLLPVATVFEKAKTVRRIEVVRGPGAPPWMSGLSEAWRASGYEIHAGAVRLDDGTRPIFERVGDGARSGGDGAASGSVTGTLVHGLFADRSILREFVGRPLAAPTQRDPIDTALDRLADVLEGSLDPAALARWF